MNDGIADMPGIEAAMERFAQTEGTPSVKLDAVTTPLAERDAQPVFRATEPAKEVVHTSESPISPDTRATAEASVATKTDKSTTSSTDPAKKNPETSPAEAPQPAAQAEPEKSRYAKSQERLTRTWEAVNAEKAAMAAEKARCESERADLVRKQAEFQAIQRAAEKPQYTPEDYMKAAAQKRQLADHQRAEAERLEDGGKYAEAEQLRKLAARNDAISEDLGEHAEGLRKQPPAGYAQRAQQFEQARQAWTLHAAKEFPDLAKSGSEFQQGVAAHLNALAKSDPQLMVQPAMIYHVSRLVAVQLEAKAAKADAARVPGLVKETESLRAKIKELEALTSPAGGGGVTRLGAEAPADDYATIRQLAESGATFR